MKNIIFLFIFLIFISCAFSEGKGFSTLSIDFTTKLVSEDRDAGNSWYKLNNDYQIKFTNANINIESIAINASSLDEELSSFDPANPPEGYTLCHGSHCHTDDGKIVSYEEIEKELLNKSLDSLFQVVSVPIGDIDLLNGFSSDLNLGSAKEIGMMNISEIKLVINSISFYGILKDSRTDKRIMDNQEWSFSLSLDSVDSYNTSSTPNNYLQSIVDINSDDESKANIYISLNLSIGASLFDSITWDSLDVENESINLASDENNEVRYAIREKIANMILETNIERKDD